MAFSTCMLHLPVGTLSVMKATCLLSGRLEMMQLKWTCLAVKCFHMSQSIMVVLMWAAPGEQQGWRQSAKQEELLSLGVGVRNENGHSSLEADGYRRDMEQVSLGMDLCTSVLSSMQMWRKQGRKALKDSWRNTGKRLPLGSKNRTHT